MRKGFHSFNTPENLYTDRMWEQLFHEPKPMKMRDYLPAHYREVKLNASSQPSTAQDDEHSRTSP